MLRFFYSIEQYYNKLLEISRAIYKQYFEPEPWYLYSIQRYYDKFLKISGAIPLLSLEG